MFAILLYLWIEPRRTILNVNLFIIGSFFFFLARIFVIPIVEEGTRQKSDSAWAFGSQRYADKNKKHLHMSKVWTFRWGMGVAQMEGW